MPPPISTSGDSTLTSTSPPTSTSSLGVSTSTPAFKSNFPPASISTSGALTSASTSIPPLAPPPKLGPWNFGILRPPPNLKPPFGFFTFPSTSRSTSPSMPPPISTSGDSTLTSTSPPTSTSTFGASTSTPASKSNLP